MAKFTIPVEQLREGPLTLEIDTTPESLDLTDEEFKFPGRVTGKIVFHLVSGDVLGQGQLETVAETPCARCLEPARATLHVPVNETWLKNKPEEPIDQEFNAEASLTRSYSGEEIELDEPLHELIMAELPKRTLCTEDCRGLCPGCGANLNTEPCRCPGGHAEDGGESGAIPEWKQKLKNLKLK
jgi:uncharacterized protein